MVRKMKAEVEEGWWMLGVVLAARQGGYSN